MWRSSNNGTIVSFYTGKLEYIVDIYGVLTFGRIICRSFQGIGGSGIYAVTMVMLYELVPKSKYPLYTTIVSSIVGLGLVLGPVFGGLISQYTTWRWVFLLK